MCSLLSIAFAEVYDQLLTNTGLLGRRVSDILRWREWSGEEVLPFIQCFHFVHQHYTNTYINSSISLVKYEMSPTECLELLQKLLDDSTHSRQAWGRFTRKWENCKLWYQKTGSTYRFHCHTHPRVWLEVVVDTTNNVENVMGRWGDPNIYTLIALPDDPKPTRAPCFTISGS